MQFDPEVAKVEFSRKQTEELVRIAFLEPGYLPEARNLAQQELANRGIVGADCQLVLERVKEDMEDVETERWEKAAFEYEIPSPLLKLTLAQKRTISAILSLLAAVGIFSASFGWNLFFGYDSWVAVAAFILFWVFETRIGPSGKELRDDYYRKKEAEVRSATDSKDAD